MDSSATSALTSSQAGRRARWIGELARAETCRLQALTSVWPDWPDCRPLRPAEAGLVMLRGRAGGDGEVFALGECLVTRCSVEDESGRAGHGWVVGNNPAHAELAARLDLLLQRADWHDRVWQSVILPLQQSRLAQQAAAAETARATQVQFFSLDTMR